MTRVDQVLAGHPGVQIGRCLLVRREPDGQLRGAGKPPDEHVFYDLSVAKSVASFHRRPDGRDRPGQLPPNYRANAAEFCRGADAVTISEHAIASRIPRLPGSSRPSPSDTTCCRRRAWRPHPGGLHRGQREPQPILRLPTWHPSST